MRTVKTLALVAALPAILVSCEEAMCELTVSGGSVAVTAESLAGVRTSAGKAVNLGRITLTQNAVRVV